MSAVPAWRKIATVMELVDRFEAEAATLVGPAPRPLAPERRNGKAPPAAAVSLPLRD